MIVRERPHGLRLFFVMQGSILPRVAPELAVCTALAIAVTLSHGFLFEWKIILTPVPFSLMGLALAIFLGFRNNTAYDRYWEGRRLWGDIVHRARSFARQVQTLPAADAPPRVSDLGDPRTRMVLRVIAFAHALRHLLRDSDPAADLARLLPPGEAGDYARVALGPDYLLRRAGQDLGTLVHAGRLDGPLAAGMDATLSGLCAAAAGCERIRNTPTPFAYTLLLHRTATIYCFLLPFGLVDLIGFMTPFVVAIVAYTFFGLDRLGDELENPFGLSDNHLPLDALCRAVEANLLQSLGATELPPPVLPVNYRVT